MTAEQKKAEGFAKLAGSEKLIAPHGGFALLDNLVKSYSCYTHDQLSDMPVVMIEELLILNKKNAFISSRSGEIQKEMN